MKRRQEFIAEKKGHHTITAIGRVVGVSHATWYRWQSGATKREEREAKNAELIALIREIWEASDMNYGLPKIHAALRDQGIRCSRKRVRRLMRKDGIYSHSHRKHITTTIAGATNMPDLVKRNFSADAPDRLWWTDITYIWTDEGWLYFAPVEDAFSRKVVGWAFADNLRTELPLAALKMAIKNRKPTPGLIHHSDRGTQYTSIKYQNALMAAQMLPSMGATGVCFDNAAAESFFASLKKEKINRRRWQTRNQAIRAITKYIRWYNSQRLHSTLGYISPDTFEAQMAA
jgi:putative transposase